MKRKYLVALLLCCAVLFAAVSAFAANPIENFVAKQTAKDAVELTWEAFPDADLYDVVTTKYDGSSYKDGNHQTVSTNTVTISGLSAGQYKFRIAAYKNGTVISNASNSNEIELKQLTVTVTRTTSSSITVQWEYNPAGTEAIRAFYVKGYDENGTEVYNKKVSKTTTARTVSGLTPNKTYEIKVSAITNPEMQVEEGTGKIVTKKILETPTITLGEITNNSAKISWNAVSDALRYTVTLYDANGGKIKAYNAKTNTEYEFTGLAEGTTYFATVRAISSDTTTCEHSKESAKEEFTACTKLVIKNFKVTTDDDSALFSWEISAADYVSAYRLFWYDSNGGRDFKDVLPTEVSDDEGIKSYDYSGLIKGTDYTFKIMAYAKGQSGYNDSDYQEYKAATKIQLARPVVTVSSATSTSITITWDKVDNADHYQVFYKPTSGSEWTTATANSESFTASGLNAGWSYSFQVKAVAAVGTEYTDSLKSDVKDQNAKNKHTVPEVFNCTAGLDTISFKMNVVSGGYYEWYCNDTYISYWDSPAIGTLTCNIGDLKPGTTYKVDVIRKGSGEYEDSDPYTFTITTLTRLATPTNFTVTNKTDTSLTLSWKAVKNAKSYNAFVNGGNCVSTDTNSIEITGLTPATSYTFTVYAYAENGSTVYYESLPGTTDSITTYGKLAVSGDCTAVTSSTATFSWSCVGEVDHYEYWYAINGGEWSTSAQTTENQVTIKKLTAGSDYYFQIKAVAKSGTEYADSDVVEFHAKTLYKLNQPELTVDEDNVEIDKIPFTVKGDTEANKCRVQVVDTSSGKTVYDKTEPLYSHTRAITVSDLTSGNTYKVVAWIVPSDTQTDYEESKKVTKSVTTLARLATPSNFTVSNKTDTSLTLSWDAVENATSYNVYANEKWYSVATNSVEITDLTTATSYTIKVYALPENGSTVYFESLPGTTDSITTYGKLTVNGSCTAVTSSTATFSWSCAGEVDHYEYCYKISSGDWSAWVQTTENQVTIKKLTAGSDYYFRIKAVAKSGTEYADSNVVDFPAKTLNKLNVPKLTVNKTEIDKIQFTVTGGSTAFRYTAKVVDTSSGETVYTKTDNLDALKTAVLKVNGLTSGNTYKVVAWIVPDATQTDCEESNKVTEYATTLTRLATPTNFTVTNKTNTSLTLSWDAVENAVDYSVTINGTSNGKTITNSVELTGLTAATAYTIRVIANPESGSTVYFKSETGEYSVATKTKLSAPKNINIEQGLDTLKVTWTTYKNVDYCKFYISDQDVRPDTFSTVQGTDGKYEVNLASLVPGKQYYVWIQACTNDPDNYVDSGTATANQNTLKKLETPANFSYTDRQSDSITIAWDSVTDAIGYYVSCSNGCVDNTTSTTYTFSNLEENTLYSFTVYAIPNDTTVYANSDANYIEVSTIGKLATPEIKVTSVSWDEIVVEWNKVENANQYKVTVNNGVGSDTTENTYYVITGLHAEIEYTIKVTAMDKSGDHTDSEPATKKVTTPSNDPEVVKFVPASEFEQKLDLPNSRLHTNSSNVTSNPKNKKINVDESASVIVVPAGYTGEITAKYFQNNNNDVRETYRYIIWSGSLNLKASIDDANTATLTWNEVKPAETYVLTYTVDGKQTKQTISAGQDSYSETITGLKIGSKYVFKLTALSASGATLQSDSVTLEKSGGVEVTGFKVGPTTETENYASKTIRLQVGKRLKLCVFDVKPAKAADTAEFTWTSSAPKILTITDNGLLKAVKAGTAKVTVKSLNGDAKVVFTVKVTK